MLKNELYAPSFSKNIDEEVNGSSSKWNFVFGLFFLGVVLGLPTGIMGIFDGLPWAGKSETLALSIFIPSLLFLGRRFFSLRYPVLFLCALLVLKAVLFFGSPSSGWLVKVHPNLTEKQLKGYYPFQIVENDSWTRTYASIWNEKASGVLKKSWSEKQDFPLDWVLMHFGMCDTSGGTCFDSIRPIIEIDGVILIPEGAKFAIIAEGAKEAALLATNESGESVNIFPAKSDKEATQQQYQFLRSGRWIISGKLQYEGKSWSLIPALIETDGKVNSDLGRTVLWQNEENLSRSLPFLGLYKVFSFVVDVGMVIFLLAWLAWTLLSLAKKQILSLPLVLSSIAAVFIPVIMAPVYAGIFNKFNTPDKTTVSYLGFSIVITGMGFLIWSYWKKDFQNFQTDRIIPSIFLLFGPAVIFFFCKKWGISIGQWQNWGEGDDWTAYQHYGRIIVVDGEWLRAGEDSFIMQPFYRYIVGIYHMLFGQSSFFQHMADVWCVLGATIIMAGFAIKFRISSMVIFIASIIYLAINLIGAFRYHIGKGLGENHAMIFMMLAAWLLFKSRETGGYRILLATIFGVFGYWVRQDHLGAIAGLAFLALEPFNGPTGGWKDYFNRFKTRWKIFACYWGGGVFSILLLSFRNWWMGGDFFVTQLSHRSFDITPYQTTSVVSSPFPSAIYHAVTGFYWPQFPSLSGWVVTIGTILGLIAIFWRPKALENFPLSVGVVFVGLLLPYAFMWNWGYPPRFSIHLLPLATLSFVFLLNLYLKDYTKNA